MPKLLLDESTERITFFLHKTYPIISNNPNFSKKS